jgi:hypothetical protein
LNASKHTNFKFKIIGLNKDIFKNIAENYIDGPSSEIKKVIKAIYEN